MINYNKGKNDLQDWIVEETAFARKYQGKCESIMCLGNGYMGLRSATEESYVGQVRNFFVSGTFNKASEEEVTELPNAADCLGMEIHLDGRLFSLEIGQTENYSRSLNLKTGELQRSFLWTSPEGKKFDFHFSRFVSMKQLHFFSSSLRIKALSGPSKVLIKSGMNGQMTNSGAQHFLEGNKRIYDKEYLQMLQHTTESRIDFVHNCYHRHEDSDVEIAHRFEMDRRKVLMVYKAVLKSGQKIQLDKHCNVYTSRDKDCASLSLEEIKTTSKNTLVQWSQKSYQKHLSDSANVWKSYWDRIDINVISQNSFNQLAIRFAQYHLMVMTPRHDNRYGIGAKGLSGEGYKGHSFWDTELFMLPFFSYSLPEIAKSLVEYRYNTIGGARKKALENGYRGAMYPWESAWADDGEVTPVWGAADIITGKAHKIWSGFIEQHITSDVAFGVWQYYMLTGDEEFMENCGYEILLDTGIFWSSRLEWNEEREEYHINDVVGPDEYKEHVNNDAFTNHTAKWCMENAIEYHDHLQQHRPDVYHRLKDKLRLEAEIPEVKKRLGQLYTPQPNKDLVIPQDDKYLDLKIIDLKKYKEQAQVGLIFRDYNLEQINEIQVSKQASVVMLMYLLEHKFRLEIKQANYDYYEPKTLHDSSLSLSTHAILAADLGKSDLAYSLFQRAAQIDLGQNMKSSDHGIHAASLGGIWQIIVCGFGGVRMVGGKLRLAPNLPKDIDELEFPLNWKAATLQIRVDRTSILIRTESEKELAIWINGKERLFQKQLSLEY